MNKFDRKISGKRSVRTGKGLLAPLLATLLQPVISSVVKGRSWRGVRRAGRGYMDEHF